MNPIISIAKKEYREFFYSPIAYVFTTVFLFLTFWIFFANFFPLGQATLRFFFSWVPILFLIFLPSITMSKWAEEKKLGTLETLLTLPLTDLSIVLGKFLSCVFVLLTILLLTLPVCLTVSFLGDLDPGPVIGGYLGLIFLGSACIGVGLYFSSLTENQIIAYVISTVVLFLFYLLGEQVIINYLPSFLKPLLSYVSLSTHFQSITRGVIDTRDVLYYLSVTGFFLYLNLIQLESRKWR